MKFEEYYWHLQDILAKKPVDVEMLKFQSFYGSEDCDCGSSTCDICNPGWEDEDFLAEIEDDYYSDYF